VWLHCANISPENLLANDCDLYVETEIKSYIQIAYRNVKEISLNRKSRIFVRLISFAFAMYFQNLILIFDRANIFISFFQVRMMDQLLIRNQLIYHFVDKIHRKVIEVEWGTCLFCYFPLVIQQIFFFF
jgi:hypothetical protein